MNENAVESNVDLLTLVEMPEWKSILLDLVRSEKMDPWDIDIVVLSQKYLERIKNLRDNNLYVPANALLACAILLNMKADVLRSMHVEEESEENVVFEEFSDFMDLPLPEEGVVESAVLSPPEPSAVLPPHRITTRKVTLEELLAAVERVMKAKKSNPRPKKEETNPFEDLLEAMEPEDVDILVNDVYERILSSLDSEGMTTLSAILPSKDPLSLVKTFLPVLYLANERKINVWQERPFDEVFISVVSDGRTEENH